jgi:hypothetical protein
MVIADKEISYISRNLEVHYYVYNISATGQLSQAS